MNPLLELEAVTLVRGGRRLLDQISLRVEPGDFVVVAGPNGAGKSSLLRAITGEWTASGAVRIDGRARSYWPREALARRMAVMTQHPQLAFDFTVREVVALGRLPHRGVGAAADRAAVDAVLAELGLTAFADRSYLALSGGERQRVQFARVVAQLWGTGEPALLLLDEPTSALDLAQQQTVLGLADRLRGQGIAVVAVLHDLNLGARYASRVVLLRGGRVQVDAAPQCALTAERISAVFGVAVECLSGRPDGRPLVVLGA